MPLEKWLTAEKYDEADRTPVADKAQPRPVNDNNPPARRTTRRRMEIVEHDIDDSEHGRRTIELLFRDVEKGVTTKRAIHVEHSKSDVQSDGQREIGKLVDILEIDLENIDDLLFRELIVTISPTGKWTYAALPATEEAA